MIAQRTYSKGYSPCLYRRRLRHIGVLPGDIHQFAIYSLTREGTEIKHNCDVDLQTGEVHCSCENFHYDFAKFHPHIHDTGCHCKHLKRALCWLRRKHFLEVSLAALRPCRQCGVAEAEFEMCDGRGEPLPGHYICADCAHANMDDLSDAAPDANEMDEMYAVSTRRAVPAFPDADDDLSGAPNFTRRASFTHIPGGVMLTEHGSVNSYQPEHASIARPEFVESLGKGPQVNYANFFEGDN